MSVARHHAEWQSLVEVSGPFLSMPVLLRVFPEGLDKREDTSDNRIRFHSAYEEWLDNQGGLSPDPAIHRAWLLHVLRELLEIDSSLIVEGQALPPECSVTVAEHGERLSPTMAVLDPPGRPTAGKPRVLVDLVRRGQSLESPLSGARWKASPATRMMTMLHGAGVRLGLVTNGEHWMLVHGAPGETTTYVSFYAGLFLEEPLTLRAFQSLLGARRLFGVPDADTLEALFRDSGQNQQEVTDQLGAQVRRAVEVLIQTFDRIDRDLARTLLSGVSETVLYEAAVTVMMRLVFLFAAEEKGLLLLGDALYDQHYAVSTLRDQLQADADAHGDEVLQRRHDAWSRLLATFRAVHGGVRHEGMRLPPYGGSLFDPDRFPFLEGRPAGSRWREVEAHPLGVDNLTVLDLLKSLQLLEVRVPGGGHAEARRLSFRALDVEQIGHVYEGLLDHTAKRASDPVLSLAGSKGKEPEIEITRLEKVRAQGDDKLLAFLKEETGRSESALKKSLAEKLAKEDAARWLLACDNDRALFARVQPWVGVVRKDTHGRPVVFGAGAVYVTEGQERRATGTHYTPKSLTEPIVQYTLEPLVYEGPADGWPKEKWKLKSAREILALRVCDMAMGSGAFLVQACRYLSERLVEAWDDAEKQAGGRVLVTPEGALGTGNPTERPMPKNEDERLAIARRAVADRCLYGVDKNPMAVEMAKLSLWLVTLQKDRPFTFVDHALRCGDSLIGLTDPGQIEHFHLDPSRGQKVHRTLVEWTQACGPALASAMALRAKLESFSVENVADADEKARLLESAESALRDARLIADLVIGAAIATAGRGDKALDEKLKELSQPLAATLGAKTADEQQHRREHLQQLLSSLLNTTRDKGEQRLCPFHWVLEFPEVMACDRGRGFHAIIGNPPFMYGTLVSTQLSDGYSAHLQQIFQKWHAKADLCAAFLRRGASLVDVTGITGLILTASAIRGESLDSGLRALTESGHRLVHARSEFRWPGAANVNGVVVGISRRQFSACILDGRSVDAISLDLTEGGSADGEPFELSTSLTALMGIKICPANAPGTTEEILSRHPDCRPEFLRPAIGGDELYSLSNLLDAPVAIQPELVPDTTESLRALRSAVEHSRPAAELTNAMRALKSVWACGETSVHLAFRRVPTTGMILRHKLVLFPSEDVADFAALQSTIHAVWAWHWGMRRQERLTYSPKRCGRTYPRLLHSASRLREVGLEYETVRSGLLERGKGLTTVYNDFHARDATDPIVRNLRELQVAMDAEVAACYLWTDLPLEHGFYSNKGTTRFTISEKARLEVLSRLLRINHEQHAQDIAMKGRDDNTADELISADPQTRTSSVQQQLFAFGDLERRNVADSPPSRGRSRRKS